MWWDNISENKRILKNKRLSENKRIKDYRRIKVFEKYQKSRIPIDILLFSILRY